MPEESRERSLFAPVFVAVLAMSYLSGCFVFPGTAGERCSRKGLCEPGLACDPNSGMCEDATDLRARYCTGKQCGLSGGFECGTCPGRTDVCESNQCVNVCAFLACGMAAGLSCGECVGATEICEANQCRDACEGKQCGMASGKDCGRCTGVTETCQANRCVNVCAGRCGEVSDLSCGTCTGATELCQASNCVDVCANLDCGQVSGVSCGTCTGATELCQANQCVNVCDNLECGHVSGVSCGACTGPTELCQSNRCVNVAGYVLIGAGTSTVGSPGNEPGRDVDEIQHSVTLTRDFWLKETEVTQGEWQVLMGNNPSYFRACGPSCPVEQVSWFDAVDYVNALSRSEGLPECYGGEGENRTFAGLSCRGYRLPTEAEWEYAARAGTLASSYNGTVTAGRTCNSDPALSPIAWYCGNSGSTTHPVRGKQANAWGLYDMLGNVREWTHDWYGEYGTGAATDPVGPSAGSRRVLRAGSWINDAAGCRAANRNSGDPSIRFDSLGFRPARSAIP